MAKRIVLRFNGRAEVLKHIAQELLSQHDKSWKYNVHEGYATAKAEITLNVRGLTVEVEEDNG
jgi:hypothetical protein